MHQKADSVEKNSPVLVAMHCCTKLLKALQTFSVGTTAAIAQLVARRSHNPKVVSSILTRRTFYRTGSCCKAVIASGLRELLVQVLNDCLRQA